MRVLIAFKTPQAENPQACHAGLGITAANTAEQLVEHGIDAIAQPVTDGYHLRALLQRDPFVTHAILCAPYLDTPFLEALCLAFPRVRFAVVFHSNVGFLQADRWAVRILREQIELEKRVPNFRLAGNCRKFCDAVSAAYAAPCALLPNLYYLHGPVQRRRALWSGGTLRIGIFGATRLLKNLMTAAWAAMVIGGQLKSDTEIWISTGRDEGSAGVLDSVRAMLDGHPGVRLVEAPWKSWPDFRFTIRRMHLLLQPSFTESFNGVTADGIAEGVPSVVSHAIDWVPAHWQADADNVLDIARAGVDLLRSRRAPHDGYQALDRHNRLGLAHWRRHLAERS